MHMEATLTFSIYVTYIR